MGSIGEEDIVDYTDFALRWIRDHPNDKYLPPMFGGPIDEIFVKNRPLNKIIWVKGVPQDSHIISNKDSKTKVIFYNTQIKSFPGSSKRALPSFSSSTPIRGP